MRKEIYNRSYSNETLIITPEIYCNRNIKGIAKMMMALYKRLTRDGTEPIKNMTIRHAEILDTRVKDIEYNQEKLRAAGYIQITSDAVLGQILHYTYNKGNVQILRQGQDGPNNSLF